MSPRTGRPKSDNPKSRVVPLRLAEDELADIQAAADQDGKKAADYIRTVALKDARAPRRKKIAE